MNELPLSSRFRTNPRDPVDEKTREDLNRRLSEVFSAGELSQEDFGARLDLLYGASNLGQLAELEASLPKLSTYKVPAIVGQQSGVPGEVNDPGSQGLPLLIRLMAVLVGVGAVMALIVALGTWFVLG